MLLGMFRMLERLSVVLMFLMLRFVSSFFNDVSQTFVTAVSTVRMAGQGTNERCLSNQTVWKTI